MWTPKQEALQKLNISLRTLRRKVKSGELTAKLMKIDNKGNNNLFIWIEANNKNDLGNPANTIETSMSQSKRLEIIINKDDATSDDETDIAQDLQQVFQTTDISEDSQTNSKNLTSTDTQASNDRNSDDCDISDNLAWKNARKVDRERAIAKFEITKCFMEYRKKMKSKGIILAISGANFVKKLNKGDFCRNALNRLQINKLAVQTLIKWECLVKASGDMESPVSLLEGYRHCGRPSKLEPFVRKMIKDLSADPRNLSSEWIYNYINDQLGIDDKELDISKRSIQLMVANFRSDVNAMAQGQGKSAVRNNVKLHNVRINDLLPGELWESDGHKCNVLVKSPFYAYHKINKRYLVRPVVIFWWDVATGLIVGYRVCLNENKGTTRNALMDSILAYGLPKSIRVDNAGSYKNVEYSPMEYYKNIKGKKKLSKDEKIAKRMLENGDMGLYRNIGIEYHFTIPGNPESKSIEAFWNYAFSPFEKHFPSWCGNTFENRPEILKKYENKVLVRKHSDMFPTWDEFCEKLDTFVRYYNSKPRKSLTTIDGIELSPIEVYNQVEHIIPNKIELITKMKYPYIEMRVVQRSMIEKNGILYWHPIFASMVGKKVGLYYDETDLKQITICNERGQINDEPAIAINPGLQSGDTLTEMIENHRRAKVGQLCYLSLCDLPNAQKIEKMLKQVSSELLTLSNTKEAEVGIKYLNFDDVLDSIAGTEADELIDNNTLENEPSDEDKELMQSLMDDIAGMFGS